VVMVAVAWDCLDEMFHEAKRALSHVPKTIYAAMIKSESRINVHGIILVTSSSILELNRGIYALAARVLKCLSILVRNCS
jgi:hypothetical protein